MMFEDEEDEGDWDAGAAEASELGRGSDDKISTRTFVSRNALIRLDILIPQILKFRILCDKVASISDDYKVLLLDASSVTENDIALYFTRIGKGGVVPSDEELAYSVLKSKLNTDFRDVIQEVHLKHGLASEPRIAHLAIRLFKSGKGRFYSGSVFSAVMEMCKTENASDKQLFYDFIKNDFRAIVDKVEEKYQLTQWHSARYASERNGDAFLLLLLAVKENGLFDGYNIVVWICNPY